MDLQGKDGGGRLAAVTGITGFIGGHLAGELTGRGWRLRVLARSMPRLQGLAGPPVEVAETKLRGFLIRSKSVPLAHVRSMMMVMYRF